MVNGQVCPMVFFLFTEFKAAKKPERSINDKAPGQGNGHPQSTSNELSIKRDASQATE